MMTTTNKKAGRPATSKPATTNDSKHTQCRGAAQPPINIPRPQTYKGIVLSDFAMDIEANHRQLTVASERRASTLDFYAGMAINALLIQGRTDYDNVVNAAFRIASLALEERYQLLGGK